MWKSTVVFFEDEKGATEATLQLLLHPPPAEAHAQTPHPSQETHQPSEYSHTSLAELFPQFTETKR